MPLSGSLQNHQLGGDLLVGQCLRHQVGDLPFPLGAVADVSSSQRIGRASSQVSSSPRWRAAPNARSPRQRRASASHCSWWPMTIGDSRCPMPRLSSRAAPQHPRAMSWLAVGEGRPGQQLHAHGDAQAVVERALEPEAFPCQRGGPVAVSRADLLERLGRSEEVIAAYDNAPAPTANRRIAWCPIRWWILEGGCPGLRGA